MWRTSNSCYGQGLSLKVVRLGLKILTLLMIQGCNVDTPADQIVIAQDISQVITLDPGANNNAQAGEVIRQLYDTLLILDPDEPSRLLPHLAERYEVSEDGSVFTFFLRKDARFATGRTVSAFDVEYSFRRLLKLNRGAATTWLARGLTPENADRCIKALDPWTLRIHLPEPSSPSIFLYQLAMPPAGIVDSRIVEENQVDGDFGNAYLTTHSAGSAEYRLQSWNPNHLLSLERAPDHWRDNVGARRIIFQHIAEFSARALLVELGDADIAFELIPEDAAKLRDLSDVYFEERLQPRVYYLALNQKHPQLAKAGVRQAFKYLIGYDDLASTVMAGRGDLRQTFIPKGVFAGIDDQPFRKDPAKARRLLDSAGYTADEPLELLTLSQSPFVEIAQSIQAGASEIGLDIRIRQMVGAQLWPIYRTRQHQLVLAAWSSGYPDPNAMAETFIVNPDNADDALLTGRPAWRNAWYAPELNRLALRAGAERSEVQRERLYLQLQKRFFEESPLIILFQSRERIAVRSNLRGLHAHTFGLDLSDMRKVGLRP